MICLFGKTAAKEFGYEMQGSLVQRAEEMYMPGLAYLDEKPEQGIGEWIMRKAYVWLPVVPYVEEKRTYEATMEDEETKKAPLKRLCFI